MTEPPLTRDETLTAINAILDHHGLQRVVVFGHSYGTITAGHMLSSATLAPRVAATLFVDPIPFLLFLPAVAYNFLYRTPRTANEWQLWYFASRDPDIARTLSRHFFWSQNLLWKEDIGGRRVGIVLGAIDQIVNTPAVHQYLTDGAPPQFYWRKDGLEVVWLRDLDHGQAFIYRISRKPMLDMLSNFVREAPDST